MNTCPEKRVEGGTIIGYVGEPKSEPVVEKPKKTAKTKTKGEG